MPLIPESDAAQIARSLPSADPADHGWMVDTLTRYQDQQHELGLPDWPAQFQAQQDSTNRLRGFFTDLKSVDQYAPSLREILPYSDNPDADRARVANIAYMASRYGKTAEEIGSAYEIERDDYANRYLQMPGKVDDLSFHKAVAAQIKTQQDIEDRETKSQEEGALAALEGKATLESMAQNAMDNPEKEVENKAFFAAHRAVSNVLAPYRGEIKAVGEAIDRVMSGGNEPDEKDLATIQSFQERLLDIPGNARRLVIQALANQSATKGKDVDSKKGFLQTFGESFSRNSRGMFGAGEVTKDVVRGVAGMPLDETVIEGVPDSGTIRWGEEIKTRQDATKFVQSYMRGGGGFEKKRSPEPEKHGLFDAGEDYPEVKLTDEQSSLIKEAKAREEKRLRVGREFEAIAKSADPAKGMFGNVLGSTASMGFFAAGTGGMAMPILSQGYSNMEYNRLRMDYPMMPAKDAKIISSLSGGAQAALDRIEIGAFKRLPSVKDVLEKGVAQILTKRVLGAGSASWASETGVEIAQDYATPLIQEVMAAAKNDTRLDVDWEKETSFLTKLKENGLAMLPLTLMGIGAMTISEYQGLSDRKTWFAQNKIAGVQEADLLKVDEAFNAGDKAKAQALYQEAWGRRDTAASPEAVKEFDAQQQQQQAASAELTRIGLLPDIQRDANGYTVRADGQTARFKTWDDARQAATQHMNENERNQAELVASMADSFISTTPSTLRSESFEIQQRGETLASRVRGGALTPEQAMESAVAGGVIKGLTVAEARQIASDVFGESKEARALEVRAQVESLLATGRNVVQAGESKSAINLKSNEQAFLTVVEEAAEGRWKAGLAANRFTPEQGARFVEIAEKATGEKFMKGEGDRALTEALSRIVTADVLGRLKDGKRIGPGSISRGLDLNSREQSALAAILNAFRQLFKTILATAAKLKKARTEGKLGAEYETLFNQLTGGGEQITHERAVEQEAKTIAEEVGGFTSEETYALRSSDFAARVDKMFSPFQADPEKRRMLAIVAKDRAMRIGLEMMEAGPKTPHEKLKGWLRILDAVLSAAPAEVRTKVGGYAQLAKFTTDRGMFNEVERRVAKLDREFEKWLVKDALQEFRTLFSKASPNGEGGKKATGKIGVEGHRWFAAVEAAAGLSEAEVLERLNNIDAMLAGEIPKAEIDSLRAADLIESADADTARDYLDEQRGILISYGNLKGKTASELAPVLDRALDIYTKGRFDWTQKVIREREQRKEFRDNTLVPEANLISADDYELSMVEEREAIDKAGFWKRMYSNGLTFLGQLDHATSKLSSAKSQVTRWAEAMTVDAEIGYKDGMHARTIAYQDFLMKLFPGKALGEDGRLAKLEKLATRQSIDAGGKKLHLSQLEAAHFTMLWKQEGLQEALDANGYGAIVQADLEQWLTPEARKMRSWLWEQYDAQYGRINSVYKALYGIDLPRVAFYAPAFFETHGQQPVLSYDGSGMDTRLGGMGHLKQRINHSARPRQVDAVVAWIQNAHVVEHWLNWAKPMKELRAVLGHTDAMRAIKAGAGPQAMTNILEHMDYLERGGLREAAAHQATSELLRRWRQGTRDTALAGKLVTIGKQLPAAYASASDIGIRAYMRGAGRVLSGKSRVSYWDMLQSRTIQRRIDQLPHEWRVSMQGFKAKAKDTEIMLRSKLGAAFDTRGVTAALDFFRTKPGQVDAALTAFSAAVAFDQHWTDAKAIGMSDTEAQAEAWAKTEATILNTAQPDSMLGKSLFENQLGEIGKGAFLFQSANRQNFFLTLLALGKGNTKEAASRFLINWIVTGVASQTIANLGRMLFSDDEPEEIWEASDYLRSMMIGPITGAMYFGVAIEALFHSFGVGFAPRVAANPIAATLSEVGNVVEKVADGDELSPKDMGGALSKIGVVVGGNWSAIGVSWNLLKQALGFAERLDSAD